MPELGPHFYVIVGLGFSAVLNHALLRATKQGREHLDNLPILHIGMDDPWSQYDIQKMGQWPHLLGLPGFGKHFGSQQSKEFLSSSAFAGATKDELAKLAKNRSLTVRRGLVTDIAPLEGNYVVTYHDEVTNQPDSVVAAKIDVCSGPGLPLRLEPAQIKAPQLWNEYKDGFGGVGVRRIMTGEDFLTRSAKIPGTTRICICGGGGVGAWCVERALNSNAVSVLWVVRDFTDGTFPVSGRNDELVKETINRQGWKLDPKQVLTPRDPRLQVATAYEVESIDFATNGGLALKFKTFEGSTPRRYLDHNGRDCGFLQSYEADQAVISIGQVISTPEFLQRMTSAGMKWQAIRMFSNQAPRGAGNFVVGFANSQDQQQASIRILAPASRFLPDRDFPASPTERLDVYEKTLARQCDGSHIPAGAVAIAWANSFFSSSNPNGNLNTNDLSDLKSLKVPDDQRKKILKERRERVEPMIVVPQGLSRWKVDCGY